MRHLATLWASLCLVCTAAEAPPAHLNSDQRIALYEKQLRAAPGDAGVQNLLASAFLQKLRETTDFAYLNRASTLVDRVLAVDPRSYDALRLSVEIETQRHNFPKAAQLARDLSTRNPGDSGALGLLGDSLMEMGRYAEAERVYQRMLSSRADLTSYNRMAWYTFVTGDSAHALSWMALAVQAGSPVPENLAWCLVEFGDMLAKTGHSDEALGEYRKALVTVPGYHRALAALGRRYAAGGEFDKAIDNFRKAQTVIPLPDYTHALAILYAHTGRAREARQQEQLLDVIDKLGQANGEKANRALAVDFADEDRNLDEALRLARGELAVRGDVYTWDAMGWVLYKSGRFPEAEEASAKALALQTPEPLFLYHAGVIAVAAGDVRKGRQLLEQALELNPRFSWPQAGEAGATIAKLVIH